MNLRSGTFYKSGHYFESDNRSKASTLGSTAIIPSLSNQVVEQQSEETLSESSMDTNFSNQSLPNVELDYDGRLRFVMENNHGALIYKDFINRYAVKIEDHVTIFDPAPWVNFQGDRYMGRDGAMYVLTKNPDEVDKLGTRVQIETRMEEEGPPRVELVGFRLVNSIHVRRVLLDDTTKVLYKRTDEEAEFYYLRSRVPENMVTDQKILYVYTRVPLTEGQNMMMLDKYGLEWEMLLPGEVRELTYMGMSIVKGSKEVGTSSETMGRRLSPLPMPTPSAPPMSILRPTMSAPRVSFREPGTH